MPSALKPIDLKEGRRPQPPRAAQRENREIGARIQARRMEMDRRHGGYRQVDAAALLSVERAMISHYETGYSALTGPDLVRLAKWLQVSVNHLLGTDTASEWTEPEAAAAYERLPDGLKPLAVEYMNTIAKMHSPSGK